MMKGGNDNGENVEGEWNCHKYQDDRPLTQVCNTDQNFPIELDGRS